MVGSREFIINNISLGSLLTFNALIIYYLNPLERLVNLQSTLQSSFVASRRMLEIINLEKEDSNNTYKKDFAFKNYLLVEDLNFQYGYREMALRSINLKIQKGSKIAFVGESGSGKSTLGKILSGYYQNYSGRIYIDNKDIKGINLRSYRTKVSYVPQRTLLFNDTIRKNLLLGINKNLSNQEMKKACKKAYIDTFIENLPYKYDSYIENNGDNLSKGQCQRLIFARSLLKNSDIYIFDEITSSLDSISENKILKSIDRLVENGKTVILISHKIKNVKNADYIYMMKNGEIVEEGKHEELIKKQYHYYNLAKLQF